MRFKLDENLPREAASVFEVHGHDAKTVLDQEMGGASDSEIADVAKDERRILLTLDTDFGDIRTYPPGDYPGFIVLRLERQDKHSILSLIREVIPQIEDNFDDGSLWGVERDQIRVRT